MYANTCTRFVTARDGTKIAWHTHDGDPAATTKRACLLLTNGLGTAEGFWRHVVDGFARDHRVIHWDYRGHGHSGPATTGDYSIRTHADDLERVTEAALEEQDGAPPIHVGFSMGVTVALELYRARADLVRGLVLLGGPADGPYATSLPLRLPGVLASVRAALAGLQPLATLGAPAFRLIATSKLAYPLACKMGIVERTAPREDVEEMARALTHMEVRAFWSSMVSFLGAHASDVLRTVRVPALVIGAGRDKFVPRKQIRELSEHMPRASTVMIERAGHGVLVEAGGQVVSAIRSFLDDKVLN